MKKCSKCKKDLPLTCFSKDRTKPLGINSRCKDCEVSRDRARQKEKYLKRRAGQIAYQKQYKELNRQKVSAQLAVKKAIKEGIMRKMPCVECGSEKSTGHHPDYAKPLEVIWLCMKHHQRLHAELKKNL